MLKRVTLISLTITALSLACNVNVGGIGGHLIRGSGNVVEESRDIGAIDGVELATIGTLHIERGDDEALRVGAEDNLLRYIETDVRGGTLVIRTEPGVNFRNTEPVAYYLTVEELDMIRLTSSGDAEAPDLETIALRSF